MSSEAVVPDTDSGAGPSHGPQKGQKQRLIAAHTDAAEFYAAQLGAKAVDLLPERERHIVASHYFRGVKFKDLGAELGVSEPRISQLHSRAIARLKELMASAA